MSEESGKESFALSWFKSALENFVVLFVGILIAAALCFLLQLTLPEIVGKLAKFVKHWAWLVFATQIYIGPVMHVSDITQQYRQEPYRSINSNSFYVKYQLLIDSVCLLLLLLIIAIVGCLFWFVGWKTAALFIAAELFVGWSLNLIAVSFTPPLPYPENYWIVVLVLWPILAICGTIIFGLLKIYG